MANPAFTGTIFSAQPTVPSKSVAATLTGAELLSRIIRYTGAAASLTLPTGALLDTAITTQVGTALAVNEAFEFTVVNTGTGTATIATGTGITLVGAMTVPLATSGSFRVHKTAASTFTVYRL